MKKIIFSFVVLFAFMASVNSQSQSVYFNEVYQRVLQLNANRFANVNQIQIGDTVLFPAFIGSDIYALFRPISDTEVEFLIANEPVNGVHDCLYRMTGKYIAGQLKTTPVPTPKVEVVAPAEKESFWFSNLFWILVLAFLLIIVILYVFFFSRYIRRADVVDINANPVLPGGLSNNALRATQQINGITAGLQIVKVERGRIFGTASSKVSMHFSDKIREVNLISGDNAYRVTQFDGSISYYRQHCGNLIAPVARGQFNLPDDWVFVPYTDEQSTWSAPEATQTEEVKPEVEEELPLEVVVHLVDSANLSGAEIATVLEAAGKMKNVPSSITYDGGLVVRFYREKGE